MGLCGFNLPYGSLITALLLSIALKGIYSKPDGYLFRCNITVVKCANEERVVEW